MFKFCFSFNMLNKLICYSLTFKQSSSIILLFIINFRSHAVRKTVDPDQLAL